MKSDKTLLQPPKGFRDFLPVEAEKRRFVMEKIVTVFRRFGFQYLETPTLEYASILEGKYGDEEKLIFKFEDLGGRELALRYDQTVPLARVVSQYGNQLPTPFKRYQLQSNFRAEKPQSGRYREFTQCDFDIIGTSSPLADAEIIAVVNEVLKGLGFTNYLILYNDRRVLSDIISQSGIKKERESEVIRLLDKLEKLGEEKIITQLTKIGIADTKIETLMSCLGRRPKLPGKSKPEVDLEAIDSITTQLKYFGVPSKNVLYTPTLARGLDYYTGMIIEAVIDGYQAGSVGGGGRYDNLIGLFLGKQIPAVGFAFGFDRLVEAMEQFQLLPQTNQPTKILVTVFDQSLYEKSAGLVTDLRSQGIASEIYLESQAKLSKQMKYADKKDIPFVLVLGPDELENETVIIKNMATGQQESVLRNKLLEYIKAL